MPKDKKTKDRKLEHIKLALKSQINQLEKDDRFYYEPLFANNQTNDLSLELNFLNKNLKFPLWISSMTGGTPLSQKINENIARACNEFGLGMGLGSCRPLLNNKKLIKQFSVRNIIGNNLPLYANLGISQIEDLLKKNNINEINDLIAELEADGLIIHINVFQEFLQPEGDIISTPPIKTLEKFIQKFNFPIIVKEVGQGMGPESIKALLKLPIEALEFGAFGGTNFSKLEISRNQIDYTNYNPFSFIGHTAYEMLEITNQFYTSDLSELNCKSLIISGGIQNFLDGYFFTSISKIPAIYGQASSILRYAQNEYTLLKNYLITQINGFKIAKKILKINFKPNNHLNQVNISKTLNQ